MSINSRFLFGVFALFLLFAICFNTERADAKAGGMQQVRAHFNVVTKDSKTINMSVLYNQNRYLDKWKEYAQSSGGDENLSDKINRIIVRRAQTEARRVESVNMDKFGEVLVRIFQDINQDLGFDAIQYPHLMMR